MLTTMTMTEILSKINLTKNKLNQLTDETVIRSRNPQFVAIRKKNDTAVNGVSVRSLPMALRQNMPPSRIFTGTIPSCCASRTV